jgi:hypothetical protein
LSEIDFEDILTIFEIPPPPQERPQKGNFSFFVSSVAAYQNKLPKTVNTIET